MKQRQKKRLLQAAYEKAGICRCMAIRKLIGNVKQATGVLAGNCSVCGQEIRVNPKFVDSQVVVRFIECLSHTDNFCRHFYYLEIEGGRVPHNFKGEEIPNVTACHCGKPPIALEYSMNDSTKAA